ncbi:uncharacterized protein BO97DRAFT_46309 [Aspergillus homomorphus CBS 101889]|uniref:Uncharacterized protein n=1 Tax=Aspergillus homomorphus (strain CBS 101889) TaxID=1450537 RepID=A0A395HZC8_ASPHC|nr:hypothetical protein BO97DRAFT_46309 [Aspergillus homomorphus CBS 101889]RAL13282.1 hypothetical protein BO97DRAFT_46309 [Aspergillus homomorphus CBS 101889]
MSSPPTVTVTEQAPMEPAIPLYPPAQTCAAAPAYVPVHLRAPDQVRAPAETPAWRTQQKKPEQPPPSQPPPTTTPFVFLSSQQDLYLDKHGKRISNNTILNKVNGALAECKFGDINSIRVRAVRRARPDFRYHSRYHMPRRIVLEMASWEDRAALYSKVGQREWVARLERQQPLGAYIEANEPLYRPGRP